MSFAFCKQNIALIPPHLAQTIGGGRFGTCVPFHVSRLLQICGQQIRNLHSSHLAGHSFGTRRQIVNNYCVLVLRPNLHCSRNCFLHAWWQESLSNNATLHRCSLAQMQATKPLKWVHQSWPVAVIVFARSTLLTHANTGTSLELVSECLSILLRAENSKDSSLTLGATTCVSYNSQHHSPRTLAPPSFSRR